MIQDIQFLSKLNAHLCYLRNNFASFLNNSSKYYISTKSFMRKISQNKFIQNR